MTLSRVPSPQETSPTVHHRRGLGGWRGPITGVLAALVVRARPLRAPQQEGGRGGEAGRRATHLPDRPARARRARSTRRRSRGAGGGSGRTASSQGADQAAPGAHPDPHGRDQGLQDVLPEEELHLVCPEHHLRRRGGGAGEGGGRRPSDEDTRRVHVPADRSAALPLHEGIAGLSLGRHPVGAAAVSGRSVTQRSPSHRRQVDGRRRRE